jgi:hypothetical protein
MSYPFKRPLQSSTEAGKVFDYAIFVQCVTPARLHDYSNELIAMQI